MPEVLFAYYLIVAVLLALSGVPTWAKHGHWCIPIIVFGSALWPVWFPFVAAFHEFNEAFK